MRAVHLQTEYLTEPLDLGILQPRFYWNCEGGITQTAYQLICKRGEEIVWDSGRVSSASMTHIKYEGKPLKSRDRVEWAVCLWDENDRLGEWAGSWFELGLLRPDDWKAKWISGDYRPKKNIRYPVDCFRKEFAIPNGIAKARLYITACGLYEARMNKHRVGQFCLAPGSTDYRKRLQYQTYDVTALLQKQNTLEVTLADGWYRGSIGFGPTNVFGRQTKLLCQLELTYTDGSSDTIISDGSFEWSNDGPIRFADLQDGEIVDASLHPSYGGKAMLVRETLHPTASSNVQPKEQEILSASLRTTPSGKKVLDFGQNMAGFIFFRITGKKGQKIRLLMGEILDEAGEFTQHNIHKHHKPVKEFGKLTEMKLMFGQEDKIKGEMQPTPKQEILFVCSGNEDTYKTTFAVFGFRYILVETDADFNPEDFKAIAVYSDMEQAGDFSCSNEKVNRFLENTRWSMKSNFLDVPTDCPQRERLGWTGDAQVFFNTAAYLMNVAPFFRKWMHDVADNQFKNGKISAVIPYNGMALIYDNTGASVGWGDAAVLVPYKLWKRYGDTDILRAFYGVMRAYAMFMIGNTGHKGKKEAKANPYKKYVYEKGHHLGEWLEPKEFQDSVAAGKLALQTEICTAYLHYTMSCMAEIAGVLEEDQDKLLFDEYADGAKRAYNWLFLMKGTPDTDRQAKLVRPLKFNLVQRDQKNAMEERLAKAVEKRGYRIGTGFLSTPFVLDVLTKAGRSELAYKMLENEESPSWLAEVNTSAATVWEDWEGSEYASYNHYSPGAVCQWMFDTIAGIRVGGENRFVIAPVPGGTLTNAAGSYKSLYGEVWSRWERTNSSVKFEMIVPANTTAEIRLPDGRTETVTAGRHEYEI